MSTLSIVFLSLFVVALLCCVYLGYQLLLSKLERQRLSTEKQYFQDQLDQTKKSDQNQELHLRDMFQSLASGALESNNRMFMELARSTFEKLQKESEHNLGQRHLQIQQSIDPLRDSLQQVDQKIDLLEKARISTYSALEQHLGTLSLTHKELRQETNNLVQALRAPSSRGRWGEMQLKRVVELAGMIEHCDFEEQVSGRDEDDRSKRPDMIIRLPGNKNIVVDAKVPLLAYMQAIEAKQEGERQQKLIEHTSHVKRHIQSLSQKSYWEQFEPTPDFVVLFLPGEPFFSAALEVDPGLIESSAQQKIIIATPTTLIALLRAVAYGWRQEAMTEHAKEIAEIGKQLYRRLGDFTAHFAEVGRFLNSSIKAYNKGVGSFERRVLVSARRLHELKVSNEDLKEIPYVEQEARELSLPIVNDASEERT